MHRQRPVLERFAKRMGVRPDEALDVAQSTLAAFFRAYRAGAYERDRGRLRSWLFGIARHEVSRVMRRRRPSLLGDRAPEPAGEDIRAAWNREWDREALHAVMRRVQAEVGFATFEAFERFMLREEDASSVARDLHMTVNAVYGAKRRVLDRIRFWQRELSQMP